MVRTSSLRTFFYDAIQNVSLFKEGIASVYYLFVVGLYACNTSALVSECIYKSGPGVTLNSATHRKV